VLGPDPLFLLALPDVLAYGPAPGLELIPYFLGLLAWAGLALAAVLLSPISGLLRRLRKASLWRRARTMPQAAAELNHEPMIASAPESPGEGSRDSA